MIPRTQSLTHPAPATELSRTMRSDLLASFVLFSVLLATAALGQYIFFTANTSPALLWPPAGIALAAVLLRGYGMWFAIACASFITALMSPSNPTLAVIAGATVAHTVAPLTGAYLLKRVGFDATFGSMRSTLIFAGAAVLIAAIVPTIVVSVQVLSHALPDTLYVAWTRSWAGRFLSILILTPFLTTWFPWRPFFFENLKRKAEVAFVFAALSASVYGLFWTPYAQLFSFPLLAAFLGVLFWIALRLNVRAMTLALLLIAVFSTAGVILSPEASPTPANTRLFATELFIILMVPIFLSFAAIAKERRETSRLLEDRIQDIEHAMRRLNAEDEAKDEFIAMLAHELRNPLASILSSVELLKVGGLPREESARLLSTLDSRSRTMGKLLDDLLDASLISQRKLHLDKKTVLLCRVVERSIDMVQPLIRGRGHTLSITLPDEPIPLEADPTRLEQIFVNLLSNAAKYTKPGGVISITVERDGDMAQVRVQDNGIGISTRMLGRIFEPFFQVAGVKRSGGMGIGLSLTRQLVELHGGTIEAESGGEGLGSEFIIRLPALPRKSAIPVDRKTLQGKKALRSAKQALNILVVDDNKSAADALGKLLSLRGHDVTVVYNGANALAQAQYLRPHAILLDIGLPDISGYEVARELRKKKIPSSLIAVTGYGQAEDKRQALAAGFDKHLTKPVGLKELEDALRKVSARGKKETNRQQGVLDPSAGSGRKLEAVA